MNAEYTLTQLKLWCIKQSGDEQIWTNKGTTYYWNRGKDTSTGLINGVVRKLAGIDANGRQIWVVAGSLKINRTVLLLDLQVSLVKFKKLLNLFMFLVSLKKMFS